MSFIRFGGWGNAFKSFRPTSKKTFSTISKGYNQLRGSGRSITVMVESNFAFFFVSNYTIDYMYFSEFLLTKTNSEKPVFNFFNCKLITTITDSCFQFKESVI